MKIKSMRNVLTTTTLASLLMVSTGSLAHAEEKTAASTQVVTQSDAYVATTIKGSYVPSLKFADGATVPEFSNLASLATAIVEKNKKFDTTFSFKYTGTSKEFTDGILDALQTELNKPGNDYANGTVYQRKYAYSGDGNVKMDFTYFGTAEQEVYVTEQVKAIAASLTKDNMTDEAKVRAVNDYVVTHTVYSKTAKTTPHHIYAYLKEGKAVCQAYALLTYRLLDEMDVEARYVIGSGNGESHAWNSVKIGDKWFHLDTTWNDPTFNGSDTLNVGYKYYLVTTETLKKDHSWVEADFPVATDDSYAYMHDITMSIEDKGYLYYSNATTNNLYKMNLATRVKTELLNKKVGFLATFNDVLYFSDLSNGGALTSYNLETSATKVVAQVKATQLQVVDGILNYKVGSAAKTYALPLNETQQKIYDVKNAISAINTKSKNYVLDIVNANEKYQALTTELKAEISNYSVLQAAMTSTTAVRPVVSAIKSLNAESPIINLQNARTAYDALDAPSKKLVSNLKDLTTLEGKVKNELAAIKAIAAVNKVEGLKFSDKTHLKLITTAKSAFAKKGLDKTKVTGAEDFQLILNQVDVYTQISKLKVTSAKYIAEVTAAKTAFDKLTPAQANISEDDEPDNNGGGDNGSGGNGSGDNGSGGNGSGDNGSGGNGSGGNGSGGDGDGGDGSGGDGSGGDGSGNDGDNDNNDETKYTKYITNIKTLTDAIEEIKPAEAVIAKITTIKGTTDPTIAQLQIARSAYTALGANPKKYITNLKDLTAAEAKVKNELAAVTAIAAVNKVEDLKFTDKAHLKLMATAKSALAKKGLQKNLVTGATTFETIDNQLTVYNQITKLKSTSAKYITEVTTAKAAFDKLIPAGTLDADKPKFIKYVTNQDTLTTATAAIVPAQAVVAQITALKETSTVAEIQNVRSAYDALTAQSKKYVTNLKLLTTAEAKIKDVLAAIKVIDAIKSGDKNFEKQLTAATTAVNKTGTKKDSITNLSTYNGYVALNSIQKAQKTRNWDSVTVGTFTTLNITGVTTENFGTIKSEFNKLAAGTGTTTVAEIQAKVTSFLPGDTGNTGGDDTGNNGGGDTGNNGGDDTGNNGGDDTGNNGGDDTGNNGGDDTGNNGGDDTDEG